MWHEVRMYNSVVKISLILVTKSSYVRVLRSIAVKLMFHFVSIALRCSKNMENDSLFLFHFVKHPESREMFVSTFTHSLLFQVILGFPTNQFGHQENSNGQEILNSLKHVRPGNGFIPKCIMMEKACTSVF